ncbi:hypothetical protein LGK95_13130 [Clostridium algoriphilum]|uniref:CD1375 family protein n=1 Tax=Clostridium algoriphilum TaxID=198347 RepID=UPI001CF0F10B|nr:CD1375 family protein [Clostridium algoriphilum]MCB2294453.1 hypothetical protein [Clostridium algoriphilum]
MVDMYYRLVKAGLRTIQKVPEQYRAAVLADITTFASDGKLNTTPSPIVANLIAHR